MNSDMYYERQRDQACLSGKAARIQGMLLSDNPYSSIDSGMAMSWEAGWKFEDNIRKNEKTDEDELPVGMYSQKAAEQFGTIIWEDENGKEYHITAFVQPSKYKWDDAVKVATNVIRFKGDGFSPLDVKQENTMKEEIMMVGRNLK